MEKIAWMQKYILEEELREAVRPEDQKKGRAGALTRVN